MAFQLWLRISRIIVPLWFLIFLTLPLIQAETHSLYYIYTGLSKPVDLPGMYEFTAMGLLDDTQIDYYNSKEKRKIPKQPWMKEKMTEDYWEKGTQTRTIKEQWFNVSVQTLMVRMRHNESDLHVLQWRTGCEVEQQGDEVKFLKGVSEFSYDGEDFLSFDIKESQWVAPVDAALPTKRKWDNVPILNQNTKDYLEKECVEWLNRFREYGDEELRNGSPPKVHVFSRKSTDETKLNLTCLATGFYPKAVVMIIRKYRTSLPEDEIKSSGIRPNHDGSYQLRKSVEIKEEEKAVYYCFVSHKSIKEQIIKTWGISHDNTSNISKVLTGAAIGGGLTLAVFALVFYILLKKNIIVCHPPTPDEDEIAGVPLLQVTGPMDKGSENSFSTDSVYHYTNPPTPDEDEIAGVPLLQVTVPMETRSENSFSTDSGRGTAGGQTDFSGSWSWDLNESA